MTDAPSDVTEPGLRLCVQGTEIALDGADLGNVQQSETAQWPADRVKSALNTPKQFGTKAQTPDVCKIS